MAVGVPGHSKGPDGHLFGRAIPCRHVLVLAGTWHQPEPAGHTQTGKPSVIPEDTVTLELRIAASTTNPIDGDLRAQLELGATATDWTRPDNTGLEGGGLT